MGAVTPCITKLLYHRIKSISIYETPGGGGMTQEEVVREIAKLTAEVSYLKERDQQLNGTIFRVDQKVDKLQFWIMASAVGAVINIFVNLAK